MVGIRYHEFEEWVLVGIRYHEFEEWGIGRHTIFRRTALPHIGIGVLVCIWTDFG